MIEFKGELTGNAKKHYLKKNISFWRKFTLLGSLIVCVPLAIFSVIKHISILFCISCVVLLCAYFAPCIIKFAKEVMPKKIYIEEDIISCDIGSQSESIFLEDIKEIYDYGEFYSFMFTNGQYTPHFVCQKDLLSKGTIEEFESLFEDKIIKIE